MTTYIRIDNDKDLEWMQRIVDRWSNYDPNDQRLQINYDQITNWKRYLSENRITVAEIRALELDTEQLNKLLTEKDAKKVKPKAKAKAPTPEAPQPKRRGRPPKAETIVARKRAEREAKLKEKKSDPYKCADHLTYGGQRRPTRDCERCWEIYKLFHPSDWRTVYAAFKRNQAKQQAEQ